MPLWKPSDESSCTIWLNHTGIKSDGTWDDHIFGWEFINDPDSGSDPPDVLSRDLNNFDALDFVAANDNRLKEEHADEDSGPLDVGFGAITISVLAESHVTSSTVKYIVSNTDFYADVSMLAYGDPIKLEYRSTSTTGHIKIGSNALPTLNASSTVDSNLTARTNGGITITQDEPAILSVSRSKGTDANSTGNYKQSINGVAGSTATITGTGNFREIAQANMYLGNRSGSSVSGNWDGKLYEVIAFGSDDSEIITRNEGYLEFKFQLGKVAAAHTYKNGPPTTCHCVAGSTLSTDRLSSGIQNSYNLHQGLNVYDRNRE